MNAAEWNYVSYDKIPESLNQLNLSESDYRLLKKTDWVVTEKVHGANFGITTDGVEVQFAKRKQLLQPDENFFDYLSQKPILEDKAKYIFANLKKTLSNLRKITIYGELFGGEYPHPDVPAVAGMQAVQTGVYYSPKVEYYAFDIAIQGNNGSSKQIYLDYNVMRSLFHQASLIYAEPLFIGKLEQAFDYNIEFESTIPKILGLPKLPFTNKAEGIVIKPVTSIYIETSKGKIRPILKKKISEFAEDSRFHQSQKWDYQKAKIIGSEALISQQILGLVTKNRLNNVISKFGKVSKSNNYQLQQLIQLLIWDVLDSFNETEYEAVFSSLSVDSQKLIMDSLETAVQQLVKDYFI